MDYSRNKTKSNCYNVKLSKFVSDFDKHALTCFK